jgi:hypothetical protein
MTSSDSKTFPVYGALCSLLSAEYSKTYLIQNSRGQEKKVF